MIEGEGEKKGTDGGLLGGDPVTVYAHRCVRPQAAYFQQQAYRTASPFTRSGF